MSQAKKAIFQATVRKGLSMANQGNPFWSKSDAMQSLALMHKINRSK